MSITQDNEKVKQECECELEWCHEPVFREGLCWEHFCEEKIEEWENQDAERQVSEEGVGYIFGDHTLETGWYGYSKEALST